MMASYRIYFFLWGETKALETNDRRLSVGAAPAALWITLQSWVMNLWEYVTGVSSQHRLKIGTSNFLSCRALQMLS